MAKASTAVKGITTSSTAEYFAKNLQQVGFSSPTKAVLTTLKEAMDNALDACEEHKILPEIRVKVERIGAGNLKNTDRILIRVEDNGPGIDLQDIPKVFGEYLASSKFGRGRCSRGQQGIGISAATTWAIQTTAQGARIITKMAGQKKAITCTVATDLKQNKGIVKDKESIDWDRSHGTSVEFTIDGRIQLNGEAGILNYLRGNILLNPHMTLTYALPEIPEKTVQRVSDMVPEIPDATAPHPQTMKLGEFITHARLFGRVSASEWLKKGFSRISDRTVDEILAAAKLPASLKQRQLPTLSDAEFTSLFQGIQGTTFLAPPTSSVMAIGEEGLALSIQRLGDIDYFSVVSRKPVICDFKPVQVEVAIARLENKAGEHEEPVQILRFANRVPLQFDKASCAIVKALNSISWKSYGIKQARGQSPVGPYVMAVSVVSPFIKFKNASKETIDASDELVEEIRRALMKAGQRLSRHLNREHRADALEAKTQHIELFTPILVDTLCRILHANDQRRASAEDGLRKILGRDTKEAEKQLSEAEQRLSDHMASRKERLSGFAAEDEHLQSQFEDDEDRNGDEDSEATPKKKAGKKAGKKGAKEELELEEDEAEPVQDPRKRATSSASSVTKTATKKAAAQKAGAKKTAAAKSESPKKAEKKAKPSAKGAATKRTTKPK
jgi:DNA topoisomerase-6 subunit B